MGILCFVFQKNGTWRSPVAHLNGVQGVAGSTPAVPMERPAVTSVAAGLSLVTGRMRTAGSSRGARWLFRNAAAGVLAETTEEGEARRSSIRLSR